MTKISIEVVKNSLNCNLLSQLKMSVCYEHFNMVQNTTNVFSFKDKGVLKRDTQSSTRHRSLND
jgi:hypothetical protein